MLPSILGNDRTELIPIGIVFMVIGIASKRKMQNRLTPRSSDKRLERGIYFNDA